MPDRIFYNVLPKSGTHLIKRHRDVPDWNHVSLFCGMKGEYPPPVEYIKTMKLLHGDFTGHVPYSPKVRDYLRRNDIRHVFIHRNLRDVAASLAWYVTHSEEWRLIPDAITEFNIYIDDKPISESDDVLSDCIEIVAEWWELFQPWTTEADTVFTYEELRPAAFLLGDENTFGFHNGNTNDWMKVFDLHHQILADELFGREEDERLFQEV